MKDYYAILGVSRFASPEEIKLAYRSKAKRFHPDLNPGDAAAEEHFKELSRAYDTLSDPAEKKKYDLRMVYGFSPLKAAAEKEELKRQWARREAFSRHTEKKKRMDVIYRRRSIYAGISILLILVIGLNLSGEISEKEQHMRDFVDKNHDDFRISRYFSLIPASHEIHTADSPYDSIFGEGRYADLSENALQIINKLNRDAIACLVEDKGTKSVIRNEFIHAGDSYNMAHVPDGTYFLRLFTGKKWSPEASVIRNIRGAFTADTSFYEAKACAIHMAKLRGKLKNSFSSYSILLNDSILHTFRRCSARDFFGL